MTKRSKPLVFEHLENISRKALEDYQILIREYVKGEKGDWTDESIVSRTP